MKRTLGVILGTVMLVGLLGVSGVFAAKGNDEYRFVIIPKVVHPWFDKVNQGAKAEAKLLQEQTGKKFVIDYRAPQKADVVLQNNILEQAAATKPDGIAIDLLDAAGNKAVLQSVIKQGIPVVIFDSEAPKNMGLTQVGNDYSMQARVAADRLAKLIGGKGEVAIMQGVPTAPNHRLRYLAHKAAFKKYPGIKVVAEGIDNDSIETAQKQAASIIAAHPRLKGFVACDAAGPIGIGLAIKEAKKTGKILSVGLDDLDQLLALIKEGVVNSSVSTKPMMQGAWSVNALWKKNLGENLPDRIDTGVVIITKDMVSSYKGF